MDYHDPVVQSDDPEDIPYFRDIRFEDCRCLGGELGIKLHGLAGHPETLSDVTFERCHFDTKEALDLSDCTRITVDRKEQDCR